MAEEESFWVSAFVETTVDEFSFVKTSEDKAGCWVSTCVVDSFDSTSFSCMGVITAFSFTLFMVISLINWLLSDTGLVNSKAPAVAMVRSPAT